MIVNVVLDYTFISQDKTLKNEAPKLLFADNININPVFFKCCQLSK